MTVKASAAGALMLAAGLFVSIAGPSPATAAGSESAAASKSESATSEKSTKSSSRYLKKKRYAYRKYTRTASKSAETGKAAEKADAACRRPAGDVGIGRQRQRADEFGRCGAGQHRGQRQGDVASDVGESQHDPAGGGGQSGRRAGSGRRCGGGRPGPAQRRRPGPAGEPILKPQTAATQTVAMAQAKPAQQENPAQASNNDSLDKTSLIGKIFIAFGTLLTMASAARMFMA